MPELMSQAGFSEVDFLKVDIEGTEKHLFSDPDANIWINRCKTISCELHDRYYPGCSDALHNAMRDQSFKFRKGGHETVIYERN